MPLIRAEVLLVGSMTRSKKENSPAVPVGQQDETPVQEDEDSAPGARKWTGDQDIFRIPEAIEITDKMRSQLTPEGESNSPALAELPPRREGSNPTPPADSQTKESLDLSRIVSSDEYNKGKTHAAPLSTGRQISGGREPERKKFLQGHLSRLVERGVVHPLPLRLVFSSILLLLSKFFLTALIIIFFVLIFTGNISLVTEMLPFFFAFIPFGLGFLIVANKARCRVCSCPLFYVRLCRKHRAAHHVPLVGIACSTALHLLFFKWMRCMYCGTAIRLRHRKPQVPAASGHEEAKPMEDEY